MMIGIEDSFNYDLKFVLIEKILNYLLFIEKLKFLFVTMKNLPYLFNPRENIYTMICVHP